MIKRVLLFGFVGLILLFLGFFWYDATYFGGRLASTFLMSCRDMSDPEARAYALQKLRESKGSALSEDLKIELSWHEEGTSDEHFEAAFVEGNMRIAMIRVFADCETEYF